MIVTETAKKRVAWINLNYDKCVRLEVLGGGCAGFRYEFDMTDPRGDDVVVDEIQIDPTSLELLQDAVIDFVADFSGEYFKVDVKNASSNCGCGRSFSIE